MKGMHMAQSSSVNVGRPREIAWRGKTVCTSVWKAPVQGRRVVEVHLVSMEGVKQW
jgi:hypothetical protein